MAAAVHIPAACVLLLLAGLQCFSAMTITSPGRRITHSLGDVLFTEESWANFLERKMTSKDQLWPKGANGEVLVHYKIMDPTVNLKMFKIALRNIADSTCIKFKQLPKSDTKVKSYLKVDMSRQCQAEMGYTEGETTAVNLAGSGCNLKGLMHEVGHALGFFHEHSRSDRDENIIVKFSNIQPADLTQYPKVKSQNYDVPYDYTSIMHYDEKATSKNDRRVLITLDPRFQDIIGEAKVLSFMDKKILNLAYGCSKDWAKSCKVSEKECSNLGYVGKKCKCICPAGTSGKKCEKKEMSYNDALAAKLSPLSKTIEKPGTVTSPGYPKGLVKGEKYVQVFKAPKCQRAVVKFTNFNITPKDDGDEACYYDILEIRNDVSVDEGEKYCGQDIQAGQVIKSDKSMLIFHYTAYNYVKNKQENIYQGYKVEFTTEPIPGCK